MNIDNIYLKKYIKYKKKYYNLKIQYAGKFSDVAKVKIFTSIFTGKNNEYNLLKDIFKKIEENENKCLQSDLKLKLFENQTCKFLKYFNFNYYPKNEEERSDFIKKFDKIFKYSIGQGENSEVYIGKIYDDDDVTYLIKKPKEGIIMESIKESYINICIINDIILQTKSHNLIFTYGLFILKYNQDPLSIFIIQQPIIGAKELRSIITTISINTYVKYLIQVFEQLEKLEQSPYQVIHGDLHSSNILIFEDNAYIIDWGKSSFLHKDIRFRDNIENKYFSSDLTDNTSKKKSGLYDFFLLIRTSYTNKNKLIDEFIFTILEKIFYNKIHIYDKATKKSIIYNKDHIKRSNYLYPLIGGYNMETNNTTLIFTKEIYKKNESHFDKYTYSEILKVIKEVYYQKYPSEIIKNKCKKLN